MANIMINETCNLRCPYCFANEFVNNVDGSAKKLQNMSMDSFERAVNFIMTNPNERIGIIGGEPTLHPQFKDIMEYLIKSPKVKNVIVFTNGSYPSSMNSLFIHEKIRVLINCNSPEFVPESIFKNMLNNIEILIKEFYRKDHVTLGINMFKVDFKYDYIFDLLLKYDYKHVRTAITIPNTLDKRDNNVIEYFKLMKPSVFKFFGQLLKRGIIPNYDCNIMPICVMNQQEIDWLNNILRQIAPNQQNLQVNLLQSSNCKPVIDILPNLSAVRCFGLSGELKADINSFRSIRDLENYFYNHFDTFAWNVYSSDQCKTCTLGQRMHCTGGCLAFKANKISEARNYCNSL